jgi:tRNA(Ile)-lysidine synthase
MPRSHPPSLITIVRRTLREECGPLRQRSVLAAVSGGGDSQAMLEVLARLAPELGFRLRAHGVDHGLRSEAGSELDLAEALAAKLGVPFARTRLEISRGSNLQARAREARYAALREAAAADGAVIATAHHALDRAETVLLRLLRGAGPRGLAVLPARAQDVIRPLLRAGKSDVLAHLSRHRIEFARDPSNTDAAFLRVRVRHELVPMLENLSPQIVRHLNALADALEGARLPELGLLAQVGDAPVLNRAQIREAQRAERLGRAVTIRLAGARDVVTGRRDSEAAVGAGAPTAHETDAAQKKPLSPKHLRKV